MGSRPSYDGVIGPSEGSEVRVLHEAACGLEVDEEKPIGISG